MFEIPVGARHVQIEEMEPVSHTIGKNRLPGKQLCIVLYVQRDV